MKLTTEERRRLKAKGIKNITPREDGDFDCLDCGEATRMSPAEITYWLTTRSPLPMHRAY